MDAMGMETDTMFKRKCSYYSIDVEGFIYLYMFNSNSGEGTSAKIKSAVHGVS